MRLAFALVIVGTLDEPVAVVAPELCGFDVKTADLPVRAHLLQDQRNRVRSLGRRRVQNNNAVLAGRQTVDGKSRAVFGLPVPAKDPTKTQLLEWAHRLSPPAERGTSRRLGAGESRSILLDGAFNTGEIPGRAGDRACRNEAASPRATMSK